MAQFRIERWQGPVPFTTILNPKGFFHAEWRLYKFSTKIESVTDASTGTTTTTTTTTKNLVLTANGGALNMRPSQIDSNGLDNAVFQPLGDNGDQLHIGFSDAPGIDGATFLNARDFQIPDSQLRDVRVTVTVY